MTRIDRTWAYVIGFGMALSPIHNHYLTELVTQNDKVGFFLPAFGTAVWLMATLCFTIFNWKKLDWGDKRVFVPLLVIAGAMGLSGITADTWGDRVAPLLMGLTLFSLYLVSRLLGKDMFVPLAIGAVVASIGIILYGIWHPGQATGGYVFELNFDIATGFITLGAVLFVHKRQWILVGLAVLALLLSGAPEAMGVLVIMGIVVIVRRDWSRKLLVVVIPIVAVVLIVLLAGYSTKYFSYIGMVLRNEPVAHYMTPEEGARDVEEGEYRKTTDVSPIEIRLLVIRDALANITPLGDGYNLTRFTIHTVHNVPLILVQQLGWPGVLAAVAWLWVSVWCLVKTKWKYAWVAVLVLSLSDHFIWTQLAPFWPAIVGVTTASNNINTDLVFRRR